MYTGKNVKSIGQSIKSEVTQIKSIIKIESICGARRYLGRKGGQERQPPRPEKSIQLFRYSNATHKALYNMCTIGELHTNGKKTEKERE